MGAMLHGQFGVRTRLHSKKRFLLVWLLSSNILKGVCSKYDLSIVILLHCSDLLSDAALVWDQNSTRTHLISSITLPLSYTLSGGEPRGPVN